MKFIPSIFNPLFLFNSCTLSFLQGLGTALSIGGSLLGALKGSEAPKAVKPANVDIEEETSKALGVNLDNFGDIQKLVSKVNTADQDSAIALMDKVLPGFSSVSKQYMKLVQNDIQAEQSGKLPTELKQEIFRTTAANNLSTGAQGQAGDFNVARNLGLGALDYQNMLRQRSLQTLSQITGLSPRINPLSTRAMLVTPQQAVQTQQFNEQSRFQSEQSQANAEAAASNAKWQGVGAAISGTGGLVGGLSKPKTTTAYDPNFGTL